METVLRISDAASLAIHALGLIARHKGEHPLKIADLAKKLNASQAHLGKVMHRLVKSQLVASRRGPKGGFVLLPAAKKTTILELYEMFDGPRTASNCLLGYRKCPFGECLFGEVIQQANDYLRQTIGRKKLSELAAT